MAFLLGANAESETLYSNHRNSPWTIAYIRPLRRHNSLHPIARSPSSYYEERHRTTGSPFSRPTSAILHFREENPLPSCAHSSHRITTHDPIYELSIRNKSPLVRSQSIAPHDSHSPLHPGRSTRETELLKYIAYFAYCHNGTYLRVQLPAEQSIFSVLPRQKRWRWR